MKLNDYEHAIVANLRRQECQLVEDGCTPHSLAFVYKTVQFFIPRPASGECFTTKQLNFIHNYLEYLELDFLPLDLWLN